MIFNMVGSGSSSEGGYIPPLTEDDFTYTGDYILVDDGNGHWRLKFIASGIFVSKTTRVIDIFCCGGGGSGARGNAASGGGGGYTQTVRSIIIYANTEYTVEVGAGGARITEGTSTVDGNSGGKSRFDIYEALGGEGGKTGSAAGANGGSGAGGPGTTDVDGGKGGSDGRDGLVGNPNYTVGYGQRNTTREFGEADGDLYGAAGGGAGYRGSSGSSTSKGGDGGDGGDETFVAGVGSGAGATGSHPLPFGGESVIALRGSGGGAGYGAGGGAVGYNGATVNAATGAGYQGIVIIRDHREGTDIIPPRPTLTEVSWEFIGQNAGRASDAWKIGDAKTITLDSALFGSPEITVRIVGFNHDDLADGSGKAGITFCMEFLANIAQLMNATNINSPGWGDSQLRDIIRNQAYYAIPQEVRDVMKLVKKKTAQTGNNASAPIVDSEDYLFLGSEYEFFGTNIHSVAGEGLQYAYFVSNAARIKKIGNAGGAASAYWLRSPAKGNATSYANVHAGGSQSTTTAGTATYVALLFCV